jgi:hypothetical protein
MSWNLTLQPVRLDLRSFHLKEPLMAESNTQAKPSAPSASRCIGSGPKPSKNAIPPDGIRCTHKDAAGRRCRSLALRSTGSRADHNKSGLCPAHATELRQVLETQSVAAELLSSGPGTFDTAISVNHMLGKLFHMIVEDRIPLRKGAVLVYASSLLLYSLGGVRNDVLGAYGPDFLKEMAKVALREMDGDGDVDVDVEQDAEQNAGQDLEASS